MIQLSDRVCKFQIQQGQSQREKKVVTMSDKVYVNGITINGSECNGNGSSALVNGTTPVNDDEKIAGVFYNAREEAW